VPTYRQEADSPIIQNQITTENESAAGLKKMISKVMTTSDLAELLIDSTENLDSSLKPGQHAENLLKS